ncbi:ribosomal protein uL16 3-hydroxylase [Arsukibacterium sp.]|uniref:ribosomal protein uL16 3-hydroxylase n=1 Tax=Arsukibacterium sp. TaxID=1977258 RepID=UPI002FD9E2D2
MYRLEFGNITLEDFMQQYWQKKPLLIKQGFKQFQDPLSADELAGLAQDEDIESRLIQCHNGDWQLDTGPFSEFSGYGERDWTLLVQAVDHWHQPAAALLEPFRFMPNWRIDDLMVSFSTPGGGVGPHLDQYDVFIIQGEGKRHWRVGMPDASLQTLCPHPRLLQVTPFTACIDVIMQPGDILYIPPGCPHEGISVENSLNYSVGFRAPAQKDLLTGLADYLLDNDLNGNRFSDAGRLLNPDVGALQKGDLQQVKQLLQQLVSDEQLLPLWFGQYISRAKHELDQQEPDPHYGLDDLAEYLEDGSVLAKLGGLRCVYHQASASDDIALFINGEQITLPPEELHTARLLCEYARLDEDQCRHFTQLAPRLSLLLSLINQGYWYFEE